MIYPKNLEQKIGFLQIREMLAESCLSALGRGFVNRMQFLDRHDLVQKLLQQTDEFQRLLASGADFPTQHFYDVTLHLNRAMLVGAFLEVQAFFEIKMSLRTIRQTLLVLSGTEENQYPALKALTGQVEIQWSLIAALDKLVDDNGAVKDDASPELLRLKRDLIHQQSLLRKQIQGVLRHAKSQGWTNDDSEPTIRGGRIVIPIVAEHKRRIKGLIHDESATGHTVFIEPDVVF
ncbi:MAG: endonuclease MutS2, partial [Hymenobacteraceae bacterium]|nr:endonuclease MutS2 [Hymenobacteraceae bacterium]